jgi:hypothetical protein
MITTAAKASKYRSDSADGGGVELGHRQLERETACAEASNEETRQLG